MKFIPLIWATLWRRKPRTILTMASVIVAFLLYAMLTAVQAAFGAGVKVAGADRLVTMGRYSLTEILPYSHWTQVKTLPGVANVTVANWFGGVYKDERNFFPQFAVDGETYLDIYPEIVISPEQRKAFLDTRTGVIVAKSLAERFGWKLGDKLPIQSTIWPLKNGTNLWTFDIVGIFDTQKPEDRSQFEMLLMRQEYFDEARQFANGTIGWMVVKVKDPSQAPQMAKNIDAMFKNSAHETRTETEKAFNQSFVKQMGDIGMIITSILGAVFFTLLLLTGNTMMQSVRDRIPELAVLKTIGFSDRSVLLLVLAESAFLCIGAALVGIVLAMLILPGLAAHIPGFTGLALTGPAFALAVGIAFALTLVVGAIPATRAMRLNIVNALSGH
ncbi:MAG TPA: FtsX-like permease family protein [Nevskiaceae bacterium]|nr:FtsX-like permease family protein [Nevskiaceae bacterium]